MTVEGPCVEEWVLGRGSYPEEERTIGPDQPGEKGHYFWGEDRGDGHGIEPFQHTPETKCTSPPPHLALYMALLRSGAPCSVLNCAMERFLLPVLHMMSFFSIQLPFHLQERRTHVPSLLSLNYL